ncbi:MAG TPA: Ig-like domain-containing protein, partial [Flavihumibacter sp.]
MKFLHAIWMLSLLLFSCGKSSDDPDEPPNPARQIAVSQVLLNGKEWSEQAFDISVRPTIQIRFNEPLDRSTVEGAVQFKSVDAGPAPAYTLSYQQQDSVLVVNTSADLPYFARYTLSLGNTIRSASGGRFISSVNKTLITSIDSTPKFPQLSDEALLTKIQEQTFKYFWDFGHPVSGLARERNTSGDLVTSGGSGFGIMALLVGIERQFITRAQGFQR